MSEIFGIGTDMVTIKRIEKLHAEFGQKFAKRILSVKELSHYEKHASPNLFLAKRFAAKEAITKALGTGIGQHIGFHDISVLNYQSGQPFVDFSPKGQQFIKDNKISAVHISLSDEGDYALAFAVATCGDTID